MLLDILFTSKTLEEFTNACDDFYTDEALVSLYEFFAGKLPTLREVCDAAVAYCNATKSQCDDNVYLMTSPNGKKYVGQTIHLKGRFKEYRTNRGSNPHWTGALKKYGFENFIIEHCSVPTACTNIVERFMISRNDLMNPKVGYNKTSGGKRRCVMGGNHHAANPVVVQGVLYSYAAEASNTKFPNKTTKYVSDFIRKHKESTYMFQVSKEFYEDCHKKNITENITRRMFETFNMSNEFCAYCKNNNIGNINQDMFWKIINIIKSNTKDNTARIDKL